jgi:hypothetical protein
MVPALPLNELLARVHQQTPVALIPGGDPMVLLNGNEDRSKANLYRLGVNQPTADSYHDVDTARYCRQMLRVAPGRMSSEKALLAAFRSPDAAAANSLLTFLAQRFVAAYQLLNCQTLIHQANPVSVTTDANGVAISATINMSALNEAIKDLSAWTANDNQADSSARSRQTAQ